MIAGLASGVLDGSALVGSAPNVAARLQGEAEPGTVVISDTTTQLVEPHFELKPIGTRSLKGIARPMELHHVVRSNLAVPRRAHGLPESVALVGREGQSRLLRFTWKRLVHDAEGRHAARGGAWSSSVAWPASGSRRWPQSSPRTCSSRAAPCSRPTARPITATSRCGRSGRMLEQLLGFYPDQPAEERLAELEARLDGAGLGEDALPLMAPLLGLDTDERWSRPEVDALALRQADAPGPGRLARPHGGVDADLGRGRGPPLG